MKEKQVNKGINGDENIDILMPKFFIRSKTNNNEHAKQYFLAIKSDSTEPALIIRKLVLTGDTRLYHDYGLLRKYRGKCLLVQTFSIKLSTLKTAMSVLARNETAQGIVDTLDGAGLSPDRQLEVLRLAKEKYLYMKGKKQSGPDTEK